MDANEIDEVVQEFLLESHENLDRLDQEFLELEQNPGNTEVLAGIFRTIHTIKGTCGFLGFNRLGELTHAGESLLGKLRSGDLVLTQARTSALLALVDAVREILRVIEEDGNEGDEGYAPVMAALEAAMAEPPADAAEPVEPAAGVVEPEPEPEPETAAADTHAVPEFEPAVAAAPEADATTGSAPAKPVRLSRYARSKRTDGAPRQSLVGDAPDLDGPPAAPTPPAAEAPASTPEPAVAEPVAPQPVAAPIVPPPVASPSAPAPGGASDEADLLSRAAAAMRVRNAVEQSADAREQPTRTDTHRPVITDTTVRVDISLLDNLMTLVGELVLARNRIVQVAADDTDSLLHHTAQQLNLVTAELQESVMKTRLQPVQTIWARFPRVVRDLAVMCGKSVRMEVSGEDTELDRTIVEAIRDPMTHMIRNAVDHGIESPEERIAKGKPAEGTIWLSAHHEGSQVNIELADDGAGIDLEAVGAKAVARGVVTQETLDRMTESQVVNLIFEPGLSTADKVTNVSGRGVGMDVVRSNIEKTGGSVEALSRPGGGTILRMKIPLTLAIVPALIVSAEGQPFAIPQVNVVELERLEGDKASRAIEIVGSANMYRLRGQLIPVVDLRDVLGLGGGRLRRRRSAGGGTATGGSLQDKLRARALAALAEHDADERDDAGGLGDEALNIVVLKADNAVFGLVVDRIEQTQEIVVKPLGAHLKDIPVYAGTTIMGDGNVALILDGVGLAKETRVSSGELVARQENLDVAPTESVATESLLVCRVGDRRVALHLPAVNRLEVLSPDRVELSGGRQVVQYSDGRLLPLVPVGPLVREAPDRDGAGALLRVIVCGSGDAMVGLVVDDIVDIVNQNLAKQQARDDGVVVASAVVAGRVTDIVDIDRIIAAVLPAAVR